jgi:hypothetical protein
MFARLTYALGPTYEDFPIVCYNSRVGKHCLLDDLQKRLEYYQSILKRFVDSTPSEIEEEPKAERHKAEKQRLEKKNPTTNQLIESARLMLIAFDKFARCVQSEDAAGIQQAVAEFDEHNFKLAHILLLVPPELNRAAKLLDEESMGRTNLPKLIRNRQKGEMTYGELSSRWLFEVIELLSIGPKALFLDLGGGFGHLLAAATLNNECAAIGIEIVENLIQPTYFLIHRERAISLGLFVGPRWLEHANIFDSKHVDKFLPVADLAFCNNFLFKAEGE